MDAKRVEQVAMWNIYTKPLTLSIIGQGDFDLRNNYGEKLLVDVYNAHYHPLK